MRQNTLSSRRFDGIRVESIHKRQLIDNSSKIAPKYSKPNASYTPRPLTSSEIINSVTSNGDSIVPIMVTSFQKNKMIPYQEVLSSSRAKEQSEMVFSTNKDSTTIINSNKYKQLKHTDQCKRCNSPCKYILKILCSILGILLLTALILPSILVFILAPKSSQTGLSELSTYGNHCAGVSPSSLWQMDTATTITAKLDTSQCNFQDTPLYFVSIAGTSNHYCLTGYGGIYQPTTVSFQIYVESTCGGWNATTMLSYAATYGWNVNWMGFYKY